MKLRVCGGKRGNRLIAARRTDHDLFPVLLLFKTFVKFTIEINNILVEAFLVSNVDSDRTYISLFALFPLFADQLLDSFFKAESDQFLEKYPSTERRQFRHRRFRGKQKDVQPLERSFAVPLKDAPQPAVQRLHFRRRETKIPFVQRLFFLARQR